MANLLDPLDEIGRQAGLTARAGLKGVGNLVGLLSDPIGGVINAATGSKLQTAGSLADTVSDAIGLPQPKNGTERVVQDAASAMASGAPLIGAGSALAQSAAPAVRSIGAFLGANPIAQTASNAASAAGAAAARENDGGAIAQLAAGLAGAVSPFAAQASGRAAGKVAQVAYDNAGAVPAVRGPLAGQDGIFAGHLSKDAPTWKLEQAKTLQSQGVPDEQIYAKTGWFAGMPDKQWRYEIPDNQASLNGARLPTKYIEGHGQVEDFRIGDTLKHDQLYSAYPSTKDIEASFTTNPGSGASYRSGADWISFDKFNKKPILSDAQNQAIATARIPYDEYMQQPHVQHYEKTLEGLLHDDAGYEAAYKRLNGEAIDANAFALAKNHTALQQDAMLNPQGGNALDPKSLSVTLHELQHAVQGREGFAVGGSADEIRRNPSGFVPPDVIEYAKSLPAYDKAADKQSFINSYSGMQLGSPFDAYLKLAGEAEARLVQKRLDYTPEQRAAIYPPSEFDVPASQQIVRFDGNGPQSAGDAAKQMYDLFKQKSGK